MLSSAQCARSLPKPRSGAFLYASLRRGLRDITFALRRRYKLGPAADSEQAREHRAKQRRASKEEHQTLLEYETLRQRMEVA